MQHKRKVIAFLLRIELFVGWSMVHRGCFQNDDDRRAKIKYLRMRHTSGAARLVRSLSTFDLTAIGVGNILGIQVYVLVGEVAKYYAGPAVVVSCCLAASAVMLTGEFCIYHTNIVNGKVCMFVPSYSQTAGQIVIKFGTEILGLAVSRCRGFVRLAMGWSCKLITFL